jgi:multiple sugar transport system permease protein
MTTVDLPNASQTVAAVRPPQPAGDATRRGYRRWARVPLLALVTVAFCYPLVWLVSASLKPRPEVFDNRLVPRTFSPGNYAEVWRQVEMATWLLNSVTVGVAAALAATVSSALVAFGFAYFRFRGRNALFALVLATMMLPGAVTMVPVFMEWNAVGLATTQVPLWANNLFGSAFYIFLLRQFFRSVPRDVFEAAQLDGASWPRIFFSFGLPAIRPALIVVLLLEVKASWTDLMKPLIYLRDTNLFTLPIGLKSVLDRFGAGGESQWELVMTASVIATIPMVLLFLVAQRYFIEGANPQRAAGRQ